ncbi:MAG TPA: NAD-dependent epimerase/dehydratase family protein [Methanocella sp.]|nr:NAD-dependent epimerase/dehydratase family protein [Methanocella sp.]
MQHRSVLVTGGFGQVGSYICEALVRSNAKVTVLDNLSSNGIIEMPGVNFIRGDIRNPTIVRQMVKDADAIVHCAAQIYIAASIVDPIFDAENNIIGTLNLLNAAREANVERFVYFSSAATYGDPIRLPVDESHPQNPLSPYGVSKLSGEKYALAYSAVYGIPATVIRPFNIYSPRQNPSNPYSGVISKFIDRTSQGLSPVIFGDGTATRDFVSVHDVVDMVLLLLKKNSAVGKAFNCGTGKATSVGDLAHTIIDLYGYTNVKPEMQADRPGDIKYSYADISRAKELLGYLPKVGLTEGLREIIEAKMSSRG